MRFIMLGSGLVGMGFPLVALGSEPRNAFPGEPGSVLFLICLLLILLLCLLGVGLLLAHRRRHERPPFQAFWIDLGWALVPVVLLWGLLLPAAVEVVAP